MTILPKLTLLSASLLLVGTTYAATPAELSQEIKSVSAQTTALQKQVSALKAELATLKQQKKTVRTQHRSTNNTDQRIQNYVNGVTVTTSPFLGLRSAIDASDLVTNLPTMNEDLRLLKQRKKVQMVMDSDGIKREARPYIELSGGAEGQVYTGNTFNHAANSDINLDKAEIDVLADVSRYASAFMSLLYDNAAPSTGFRTRTNNSRIFLRRGFLTIGDLTKTPFYFTLGQMYVPFGRYAGAMVSAPVTLTIARTLTRAALFGYDNNGLYAQGYAFNGDTKTTGSNYINQYGLNAGYQTKFKSGSVNAGIGYISNMADSEGMQSTGASSSVFNGFGETAATEQLSQSIGGLDLHTELAWNQWSLVAEYVGAVKRFNSSDLTFNGQGARPQAIHAEAIYTFNTPNCPTNMALTFGHTWQALALNAPRQSMALVMNTSLWKDTIESLEFRHDINYAQGDTAGGRGSSSSSSTSAITGSRKTRDMLTAQIGVYF